MSIPATLPGPRRGWRGVTLTVVATLAIVVTITVAVQSSNGSGLAPNREDVGRIDRGEGFLPGPDMRDTANLEQLVSELQTVYGTTEAIRATVYADHVTLLMPRPDDPGMQQRLTYNGIFHREVEDERRTAMHALIDLRTVDWEAVIALIDDAQGEIDAQDPDDLSAMLTEEGDQHQVRVSSGDAWRSTAIEPIG